MKKFVSPFLFTLCTLLALVFFLTNSFPNWAFFLYLFFATLFFAHFVPWQKSKEFFKQNRADIFIASGLFLATVLLYLFRITEITPGMWGDEVGLGWMVQELVKSKTFIPFLPYNFGHPTLLVYISAFFISLMGRSIISLRIVSVLFGALSVSAFYILLRQFFQKKFAAAGSILHATSYVLIIVSRFAYEMSAGVCLFICSLLALYLLYKKPTIHKAVALGFFLAIGLYTYLAFRTLLPIFLLFLIFIVWKKTKEKIQIGTFFVMSFLMILFPLLSYSMHYPKEINARVDALSVFGQNLPPTEVLKELQGASSRTLTMFFTTGDPNPRQNPANTTPFDIVTSLLFLAGLIFLLIKKRALGIPILLFALTILATEIITLERIPEFHYYGLGHPNTLRISLLIPLVIFCVVWIVKIITDKIQDATYRTICIIAFVILVAAINLVAYFNQPLSQWIYSTNFVVPLKVVNFLNKEKPNDVALSNSFYTSQHIQYFLNPAIHMHKVLDSSYCNDTFTYSLTILAAQDVLHCTQKELAAIQQDSHISLYTMQNPWNTTDAVIVVKR